MKLDKEIYTKHAKRLSSILNEKSTFVPYLAKEDFVKVLSNSLNTLNVVENKLTNVELPAKYSCKTLVKQFNKLGNNTFKVDDKFKYEDDGDLIDNINYLHMYCKNIFKVDLDDMVEGKEVKVSNPKVDFKAKTDVEDISAGMAGIGAMGVYENPLVMGQAYARVKQDMASGQIYSYKSKPKSVVIAKIASIVTVSIAIISLIIGAIFAFLSANLVITGYNAKQEVIEGTLGNNAIFAGVLYILIACYGVYILYQNIRAVRTNNDNLKYYYNWPWMLIFILMMILFVVTDFRQTWSPWFLSIVVEKNSATTLMAHNAWKIMYLIIMSSSGLCLVPMIIGAVCNPKQDADLLKNKLKEYADEIVGSFKGPSAPSDVQKPVDVKKPEKDSKSKK